jgi:competence protein ComEC
MTLIYLGCAWLGGILLASLLSPPLEIIWLAFLLPITLLLLWRRERGIRLCSACSLILLLGAWRYLSSIPKFDEKSLAYYNDRGSVLLRGVVALEPDVNDTYVNLRVEARSLVLGGELPVQGAVLVRAPRYPEYSYGDFLEIEGEISSPPYFEEERLARQGIYSFMRYPRITLLAREKGNPFYAKLLSFKRYSQTVISRILPSPESSLLEGILLGVESGIPEKLMKDFSLTGTSHLIAISGFNISIIAGVLGGLCSRLLGRRKATLFVIAGVILYTFFVGAGASVVRAAIMGILYLLAVHYGRQTYALNSLVFAAFLMSAFNPLILWDLGFQLSFASTLGLVLYTPALRDWFERIIPLPAERARKAVEIVNESFIVTSAAQITTLPIVVYNFRRLSLITLLTNLLILPAQAGVMLWGGIALLAGLIYLPLGRVFGWVAWLFLTYTIRVVEITARVPLSLNFGRVSPGFILLYYVFLAGVTAARGQKRSRLKTIWGFLTRSLPTKALIFCLTTIAILVWIAVASLPDGKLHVIFFDVGQGDAILIQTPRGGKVLIDGGPSPRTLEASLGRRLPFWDRKIDLVVLTHPEEDHLSGLIPILERYNVGKVLQSPQEHSTSLYAKWLELIEERSIPLYIASSGMEIKLEEGLKLSVLHPERELMGGTGSDMNNNSVVLRLSYGEVSFLLTGDIEVEAEAAIMARGMDLTSTVLKAPHHGSETSLSSAFLEAVNPRLVVISCEVVPSSRVLNRLSGREVFRTDESGTIELITDGERIWVRTEQ